MKDDIQKNQKFHSKKPGRLETEVIFEKNSDQRKFDAKRDIGVLEETLLMNNLKDSGKLHLKRMSP